MVRIRLRRVGSRHQPSYRIVAADKESPRNGRFLEAIGHYNPRTEPASVQLDEARLFHWMNHGAQPSESVVRMLKAYGAWSRWERLRGGEALESLLEEAKQAVKPVNPKTRRVAAASEKPTKRASKKAEPEEKAVESSTPSETNEE